MKKFENLNLDNQLCFALYAATHAITRSYRDALDKAGLTYPQYLVMLVLLQEHRLSIGKIAKKLNLDSATLTPLLKRIEGVGLVKKERSLVDERIVEIEITPKGLELHQRISEVQKEVRCKTGLSKDDFESLKQTLHLLTDVLSRPD